MTRGLRVEAHSATDVGRVREANEDSLLTGSTVFAVADGMGGHQAGEVASRTALEPIRELDGQMFASDQDAQDALIEAVVEANRAVVAEGDADPKLSGMGTTLTAVTVRDGKLHIAHVGDSRAYLLRPGDSISQLTTDHTLVEQLVRDGRLSREEAATHPQRSVITRAIGVEREIEVDSLPPIELQPGDQILLCSDGLTGPLDDAELTDLLDSDVDGDEVCRRLIASANDAGGPDNITVVLLRVSGTRQTAGGALADTESLPPVPPPGGEGRDGPPSAGQDGPTTRIHTRSEDVSTDDWAERMGHLAKPQGVDAGTGLNLKRERGNRGRRIVVVGLAVVVLLALAAGGTYALLSRAYFIGDLDGEVTIFHGIPSDVAGIRLHWVAERGTGVRTDDLPPFIADRVRNGEVTAASLVEARRTVERYRELVEEAEDDTGPDPDGATDPDEPEGEATRP